MQPVRTRTIMTTLLATSLASLGYAQLSPRVTAQNLDALIAGGAVGSALQQDEPKPQDERKPKETPDTKSPKADKQEKPAKQQKPDVSQKQKPQDQKQDQKQAQNQKQDKDLAKQEQRADKGQEAKGGGRIPDKDFKTHFGQEHKFNVRTVVTTTRIVPNQTRFVYTGYTFVFVDPWPAGWALDDDCYIDYINGGYYLIDFAHPGVQIALTIVG